MELQPKRPTLKGPDAWFTGDAFIDPVTANQGPTTFSLGSVLFTPCAHTAWHHHTLGQTLYVTEGEGYVQSRGGPLITIRPGDVVVIDADEEPCTGPRPPPS